MFDDLELQHAERQRHRENSARLAQAFTKFETTGQGSMEFGDRVDFGLTFIEEPYIGYGVQVDLDELGDLLDVDPGETPPIPLSQGYVTAWDRDDRDFYVGCWIAVSVAFANIAGVAADVEIPLAHHFTFTAIAMKDVPIDVRD